MDAHMLNTIANSSGVSPMTACAMFMCAVSTAMLFFL